MRPKIDIADMLSKIKRFRPKLSARNPDKSWAPKKPANDKENISSPNVFLVQERSNSVITVS